MSIVTLIRKNLCCSFMFKVCFQNKIVPTLSSRSRLNLLFGFVPFIPSVSAQNKPSDVTNEQLVSNTDNSVKSESEKDATTGWDRLKVMYSTDEFGNLSKEITATLQCTSVALICGFLYGGVIASRAAFIDFMERNQATIFDNTFDAKKRLQNHVSIHFGKGAFRWGLRMSVFTGGFMLFLTSLSSYRGYTSVLDYMMSGAVVGALLRLRLGPPAIIVGATLGGVLGLTCGLSTISLLSLTGHSFDEVLSFQYEIDKSRAKLYQQYECTETEKVLSREVVDLLKTRQVPDEEKKV